MQKHGHESHSTPAIRPVKERPSLKGTDQSKAGESILGPSSENIKGANSQKLPQFSSPPAKTGGARPNTKGGLQPLESVSEQKKKDNAPRAKLKLDQIVGSKVDSQNSAREGSTSPRDQQTRQTNGTASKKVKILEVYSMLCVFSKGRLSNFLKE